MSRMSEIDIEANEYIRAVFDDINWKKFDEISRAATYELYYGPLGAEYWSEVDPLEHYKWGGWSKAIEDLGKIVNDLPWSVYYTIDGTFDLKSSDESLEIPVANTLLNHELANLL